MTRGTVSPPCIVLGDDYVLNGWRPEDAAAHREFGVDADAARFFGWTVAEAEAAPNSHYAEVIRRFDAEWREGTRYSLAIRRRSDNEAVGAVELRPDAQKADVSYVVTADRRGQGVAPRALEAMLAWGARELGLREASITCHAENTASKRVAEKCGFGLVSRSGEELRFRRRLDR